MAISWKPEQRTKVAKILDDHPLNSGRCAEAAQKILPVARACDPRARLLSITPRGRARYVQPTVRLERRWYHHVTTEAVLHCVDILTGADGTEMGDYLGRHWMHPEWLEVKPL